MFLEAANYYITKYIGTEKQIITTERFSSENFQHEQFAYLSLENGHILLNLKQDDKT